MKTLTIKLVTTLGVLWAGTISHAAEVASTNGDTPVQSARGGLNADDAARLFSGQIPSLSHLDRRNQLPLNKYGRKVRSDCVSTWNKIRAFRTVVKPVAASLSLIRANAARAGVPSDQLDRTLATYLKNQKDIPNQRFITIVDFSKRSNQKRLFTIELKTGQVRSYFTTGGRNSDRNRTGYSTEFSNRDGSLQSSVGCFIAAGYYERLGDKRPSMMLHGFEPSNDIACSRAIIMHPANYVGSSPARSNGCLALRSQDVKSVYGQVGGGGLICAYPGARARSGR